MTDAADGNFVVHATWAPLAFRDARVRITPDLVLVDSGLPTDTFNVACRARFDSSRAAQRVAELVAFFEETGRPFSFWLTPGSTPAGLPRILEDAGLVPAESELAMEARIVDLAPPRPVAGLTITRVATPDDLAAYARILAAHASPPDENVLAYHRLAGPRLLGRDAAQRLYLGRREGVPVATAEVTIGGGVAGVYNVATRIEDRRVGIGSAMTYFPLAEVGREGIGAAILQAAPDGIGVYRRLGFGTYGEIREFKPAPETR